MGRSKEQGRPTPKQFKPFTRVFHAAPPCLKRILHVTCIPQTNEGTSLPESGRRLLDHQSAVEQGRAYVACVLSECVSKGFSTVKFRGKLALWGFDLEKLFGMDFPCRQGASRPFVTCSFHRSSTIA